MKLEEALSRLALTKPGCVVFVDHPAVEEAYTVLLAFCHQNHSMRSTLPPYLR